jgi:hypothetical protein
MGAELTMACTSDFSGLVRGKGFRSTDLDRKVARGIGWTPTNVQITCFDTIADSPYGALGDLVLRPDPGTLVNAPCPAAAASASSSATSPNSTAPALGVLHAEPPQGRARAVPRGLGARPARDLRARIHAPRRPGHPGLHASGLRRAPALRRGAVRRARRRGIAPDSFLREYGPDQMEITLPPAPALRAADEAVIVREVTRATAAAMGLSATFSPLCAPDIVGNGVHIHLSLWDGDRPVTHDPDGSGRAVRPGLGLRRGGARASQRRLGPDRAKRHLLPPPRPPPLERGLQQPRARRTARRASASAPSPRPTPPTAPASSTSSSARPMPPPPPISRSPPWSRPERSGWRRD